MFLHILKFIKTWRFLIVFFLVYISLWFLVASSIDLGADEAHYVLYGIYLDWSYFDHPPLVGWIQSVFSSLFGYSHLIARLPSLLCFFWTVYEISLFKKKHYSSNHFHNTKHSVYSDSFVLKLSAFTFSLVPFGLSMFFLPDTILLPLTLLTLRVTTHIHQNHFNWILFGLLMGLCGLSKYTAIFLVPAFLIGLAQADWDSENRISFFKNKFFYLSILVSCIVIFPVIYWNWLHEGISFKYQINHLHGNESKNILNFLKSFMMQWIGYGINFVPWVIFFIFKNVFTLSFKEVKKILTKNSSYLTGAFLLTIYFVYSSFSTVTLPHWPLINWYLIFLLLENQIPKSIYYIQLFFNLIIILMIIALLKLPINWDFKINLREIKGWNHLMTYIENHIDSQDAVYLTNWSYGSRALLYSSNKLREKVQILDTRFDQFDLWEKKKPQWYRKKGILIQFREDDVNFDELDLKCSRSSTLHTIADERNGLWKHQFFMHYCEPK